MTLIKQVDNLMELGERLHFLSAIFGPVLSGLMGSKPEDTGPLRAKAAYYFFGLTKEEERRLGVLVRKFASEEADDAKIFMDLTEWLFTPTDDSTLQWLEASVARNGLFIYIAKVDELTKPGKKIGTTKTTTAWNIPDPENPGKTRKVSEVTVVDKMEGGGSSEGLALIKEIVTMIKVELGNDGKQKPRESVPKFQERKGAAFRLVQQRLYHARGISIRKVGDADFEGWLAAMIGLPKKPVVWICKKIVEFKDSGMLPDLSMKSFQEWVDTEHEKLLRRRQNNAPIALKGARYLRGWIVKSIPQIGPIALEAGKKIVAKTRKISP